MRKRSLLLASLLITATAFARADTMYLRPEEFLKQVFGGAPPTPSVLDLDPALRDRLEQTLGHPPRVRRLRYWADGRSTAWLLDEIGKERPISVGVAIERGKIAHIRVLVYRESRGWEISGKAFLEQFHGASLGTDQRLDRGIDGIAGATLSVRAIDRIARFALLLDERITRQNRRP
ncbi:MAG: FMN-binding protein [Betaproteobacteria bacterium]|nr:FMN-binding protein [Betaproteobacteria bacterium]